MADPNVTLVDVDTVKVIVGAEQPKTKVITKSGPQGATGIQGPAGAQGIQGFPGSDGALSVQDQLNLEMEIEYKTSRQAYYKETTFVGRNLTNVSVYTNSSKTTKMFNKDLIYVNDILSQTVLTRISDLTVRTSNLIYNGDGSLHSVDKV